METKMTVTDALKVVYNELAQVNVPAELTFSIGVHVGKSLMIIKDCIDSIERNEQINKEKTVPLFPEETAKNAEAESETKEGRTEKPE